MFKPTCGLCGGRVAYLPRPNWRPEEVDDPRNVVPVRLELCADRVRGVLVCQHCDVLRNAADEIIAAPPRWVQAVMVP